MTITNLNQTRPRRRPDFVPTPESREVTRLEGLLADPQKAGFRVELEQELATARARLVALTATTVLAA
jgi:hypothetical protein